MDERLDYLIDYLSCEGEYFYLPNTVDHNDKWLLFRSLVNTREPKPVSKDFLSVQDEVLQSLIIEKGITDINELQPVQDNI